MLDLPWARKLCETPNPLCDAPRSLLEQSAYGWLPLHLMQQCKYPQGVLKQDP